MDRAGHFDFSILEDQAIILENIWGAIDLEELKASKLEEIAQPDFDPAFSIITNMTFAQLDSSKEAIAEFVAFLKKEVPFVAERKLALIADSPKHHVAGVMMHKVRKRLMDNPFSIFSSFEGAARWIGLEADNFEKVETCYEQLLARMQIQ